MVVSLSIDKGYVDSRTDAFSVASLSVSRSKIMITEKEAHDPLKNRLLDWLSRMGLNLNPFEHTDSGKDPFIPFYLVDHDQFENIYQNQPSFVFAPAGGGKTAFRVRLARECRAGRNGRRIFPIVYKPTIPSRFGEDKNQSTYRQQTDFLRFACQELFLQLSYYPYVLDEMDDTTKRKFLQTLDWDLDYSISYYLHKIKEAKDITPIIKAFDPTARSLPNPPRIDDIEYLYRKLSHYSPSVGHKPDSSVRLEMLFDLVLNGLKFEAIYVLVDGVDAFFETSSNPEDALATISWLLDNSLGLSQQKIFLKSFLPSETLPIVQNMQFFSLLTSKNKIITINWDTDALSEVIRQRLQEASGGKFDGLAAISNRALRASGHSPEELIIGDLRRYKRLSPRNLIKSINWMLINHVRSEQATEKLTPQDLAAVRKWMRSEYSAKK